MKTISFVIPVYNEEKRLSKTFKALKELELPYGLKLEEVIFVNDGSTDQTASCIKYYVSSIERKIPNNKYRIKLISYKQNKGKGYAIKKGMLEVTSDYALFFDADISTPLSELSKFVPKMQKNIDVIIGTRKNGKSTVIIHQPILREFLGRMFTKLATIILNVKATDFTCGFKAFSQKAYKEIFSQSKINGWTYDAEIILLAKKLNYSSVEVPVLWANDSKTKVRLYNAIPQVIMDLLYIRWSYDIKPLFNFTPKIVVSRFVSIFL